MNQGIDEEEKKEEGKGEFHAKDIENIFNKITAENSPNIGSEMTIQIQETFTSPNRIDQKRTFLIIL